ncbi:MAG: hypothetical protein JO000_29265 [Alphaproteobacteria bacterium]|nr:hypothetical protein [Alphaproteobacteria bacterium]
MPVDHIRYDLLTQQALRAVVRRVLSDVAKTGALPGEHHFYVTFDTRAPGVKLSPRLREQYPEDMTIVLQHQFWDLIVTDAYFEVGLSFNGISERLHVPLEAIKGFFDPSVQFGLQFELAAELDAAPKEIAEQPAEPAKAGKPKRRPVEAEPEAPAAIGPATPAKLAPGKSENAKSENAKSETAKSETAKAAKSDKAEKEPAKPALVGTKDDDEPEPDKPSGGAEVVRLDRFRKK